MMFCEEWSKVKRDGSGISGAPLYCNSWKCPVCAPRRRKRLLAEAFSGKPDTFITLTVNPAWAGSASERREKLAWAWNVAVKLIKRRYKLKALPFFIVVEKTLKGEPHFHILLRSKWIDQSYLSKIMKSLIDAPIVDIRRVQDPKRAVSYVAKYVAKEPAQFGRSRRYWKSRDWNISDGKSAERFGDERACVQVRRCSVYTAAEGAALLGFEVWWNSYSSWSGRWMGYGRGGFIDPPGG